MTSDKRSPLDFGKLKSGAAAKKQLEPRKIFTTLKRDVKFKRPLDEQADVLEAWFEKRDRRDITLKMNTGSGKTVATPLSGLNHSDALDLWSGGNIILR